VRGQKQVFLSHKRKEDLVPKWMSRPGAPTLCEPISAIRSGVVKNNTKISVVRITFGISTSALPTRRCKHNFWHCVAKRGGKCGPGSEADLDLIFESRFWRRWFYLYFKNVCRGVRRFKPWIFWSAVSCFVFWLNRCDGQAPTCKHNLSNARSWSASDNSIRWNKLKWPDRRGGWWSANV